MEPIPLDTSFDGRQPYGEIDPTYEGTLVGTDAGAYPYDSVLTKAASQSDKNDISRSTYQPSNVPRGRADVVINLIRSQQPQE